MSKYFIDTEFIESFRKPTFGKRSHFVDLISIGIKCEDGREYYAISNQFDPQEASKWVQDNVLYRIMLENGYHKSLSNLHGCLSYSKRAIKYIQKSKGKHPATIGLEVRDFCGGSMIEQFAEKNIEFYGYYADYDWVVFCAMFGTMMDLPKGFPMYCRDLKQIFDSKISLQEIRAIGYDDAVKRLKAKPGYPKQDNEHNALEDAKWNKELYDWLNTF